MTWWVDWNSAFLYEPSGVADIADLVEFATAHLLEWLADYAPYEKLAIVHAGAEEEAEALHQQTLSYFPQGEVLIAQITPVLGAHLGIGALGFAGISKE